MADNIEYATGGVTTYFARLDANPQGARQLLMDITSPGVDGVAYRKEASRAPPFEGQSLVYVANFTDAATVRAVYEALVGKLVTLDHQGIDYTDILVLDVQVAEHRPVGRAIYVILPDGSTSTGNNAVEVRARWSFQYGGAVA